MILISRTCGKCLRVLDTGIVEFTGNPVQEPEAACRLEVLASGGPNPRAIKLRSMLYPHFYLAIVNGYFVGYVSGTLTHPLTMYTYALTQRLAQLHTHLQTLTHTCLYSHLHLAVSHKHTHTPTLTHALGKMYTHTHTHTHTQGQGGPECDFVPSTVSESGVVLSGPGTWAAFEAAIAPGSHLGVLPSGQITAPAQTHKTTTAAHFRVNYVGNVKVRMLKSNTY